MSDPPQKPATYADVLAAPEHLVAELIDGTLHTMSRPRAPHANATTQLGGLLGGPFHSGRGGPGGWVILFEPELHLRADVLVPNVTGWRRTQMPEVPDVAYFELAPDWCCEVLSPSTQRHDRVLKVPRYARAGVGHVWLLDAEARMLEVLPLDGATYRLVASHGGDEEVRAEPFDAVALPLAELWK